MAQVDSENTTSMLAEPILRKFLIVAAIASAISACTLAAATMATQSVPAAVTMPRCPAVLS